MPADLVPRPVAPLDQVLSPSSLAREPNESPVLCVKRHSELACIPTHGSKKATGYNLFSTEVKTIPAHGQSLIDTQISIAIPKGTYG